jgi:hypothetical protein
MGSIDGMMRLKITIINGKAFGGDVMTGMVKADLLTLISGARH